MKRRTKIIIKSKVLDDDLDLMDVRATVSGDLEIAINALITASAELLKDTGNVEQSLETFIKDLKREVRE